MKKPRFCEVGILPLPSFVPKMERSHFHILWLNKAPIIENRITHKSITRRVHKKYNENPNDELA